MGEVDEPIPNADAMAGQYWTNRLSSPEDTTTIRDLVASVYPNRVGLDEDYWQWRYLNDSGFRADTVMAEHEGQAVGIQPVAVFDYQWGRRRLKGAVYTGVITHPNHPRRGIFRSLIDGANRYAAQRGAQFSITMPNDESLPGFLRFEEWTYPGPIPLYLKVVDGAAALRPRTGRLPAYLMGWLPQLFFRRRRRLQRPDRLGCKPTTTMPEELNEVFDEFARDCGALTIRRTAAYWNWRYGAKPGAPYHTLVACQQGHVTGAVVTSVQRRGGLEVGMVVDVVARHGITGLRRLLQDAETELLSGSVGLIACQATSPLLQQALREEGYLLAPPKWLPKRFHFVYRLTGAPGLPRSPDTVAEWHLTFGDSDNV